MVVIGWDSSKAPGLKTAIHIWLPSVGGASKCSSDQYRAVVPDHGSSPSELLPMSTSCSFRSSTTPANAQPSEHRAPIFIVDRRPTIIGDSTSHTARLMW